MKNLKLFLVIIILTFTINLQAKTYIVSSADEFNELCSSLNPGDSVIWQNGTYSDQNIQFYANGTEEAPIILKAQTDGGVIFQGLSEVNIAGQYLILEGFYWKEGEGASDHIEFRKSGSSTEFAEHCILRNCAMNNLYTEAPNKSRWIVIHGYNNIIENCSFYNKLSTGALILVELAYQDPQRTAGHIIRNNYFYNIPPKDDYATNTGDCEAIRIGVSTYQTNDAGVTVENNYFYEVDGENEIITNKSSNNKYLHNTFRKCRGSLVLRHGTNAWVEGNFFLGEGKEKSGGIRISDSHHIIINNYMQDLSNSGDKWNNGITLVGGTEASGGTGNGYQYVEDVLIAFNTIYNCDDPIYFNDRGSFDPKGIIAYNNIYSTKGDIISGDISGTGQGMSYIGNIFGGSNIGITDTGIIEAEVNFIPYGEIYKPATNSAVIDAAGSAYNTIVTSDIEGYTRPSDTKDVGAFEVVGFLNSAKYRPFSDKDVGNIVGANFLDAYGNPIVTSNFNINLNIDITNYQRLYLFPNPVKDILFYQINSIKNVKSIKIYNINGDLVLIDKPTKQLNKLNITQLKKGRYLILTDGEEKKINQFYKQ